jgi:Family of unknown function (DUF6236)
MAGPQVRMPRMAVYYPYIHFRDERWLKVAALYWPRMVRIVSPDYPTRDSRLVAILKHELDFVVEHPPGPAAQEMVAPFTEFIATLGPQERASWRLSWKMAYQDPADLTPPQPPPALDSADETCTPPLEHYGPRHWARPGGPAGVHTSELSPILAKLLVDAELAVPTRGEWLAMHPELAWIYKCRLTEEFARRNNLFATTDQVSAHAVVDGPFEIGHATDSAAQIPATAKHPEIATAFGLLAITAVVPRNLDQVPPEKIVEIRRRFGGQFDRWRQYIDAVGDDLAEQLHDVESPVVLDAYLSEAVRHYAAAPVEDLRRGLVEVGVDAADLAINSKFQLPAGLAAAGLLAQPHLAAAGGLALGAVSVRRATRAKAKAIRAAPAAYLLSVQETLAPQTWLQRVIAAMRRAAGLSG